MTASLRVHDRLRVKIDDEERLAALRLYGILDTPEDPEYERLAEMLRVGCRAKWSTITFVDRDRQWFKATHGCPVSETPRSVSFCSVSMHQPDPLIVPDARLDERFKDSPTVVGDPFVRFYAGFPIFSEEGYGLGSVCVNDTEPRTLTKGQMELIEAGRDWVLASLALRRLALEQKASGGRVSGFDERHSAYTRRAEKRWTMVEQLYRAA